MKVLQKFCGQSNLVFGLEPHPCGYAHFDQQFDRRNRRCQLNLHEGWRGCGMAAALPPAAERRVVQSLLAGKLGGG